MALATEELIIYVQLNVHSFYDFRILGDFEKVYLQDLGLLVAGVFAVLRYGANVLFNAHYQ